MRKVAALIATVVLFTTLFSVQAFAITLPLRVMVNGQKVNFPDAQPFVDQNYRTQVPVRFVSEALRATVNWEGSTGTVTVTQQAKKIVLVVGKREYTVNGQKKSMDTSALLQNKRTFVPLRFVSEALGATVTWDEVVRTAYIETAGNANTPPPADDQVRKEVIYGFTVYYNTGSQLLITKGPYDEYGKEYALLDLSIILNQIGSNYKMETDEAEAVLRQKIEPKVVDSIMAYVRTKTHREPELPQKIFTDKTYQIFVVSQGNDGIGVTIFLK